MIFLSLSLVLALAFFVKKFFLQKKLLKKYTPLINIDKELFRLKKIKNNLILENAKLNFKFDDLEEKISVYSDDLEMIESGFYTPKYNFKNVDKYKDRLDKIRDKQKTLIKDKQAIICNTEWTVRGSKAKGRKMINHTIKLGLNAFNVQCDNAILKVTYKNIVASIKRLEKINESINKLLEPNDISIKPEFFKLKVEELKLAYEYEEKLQATKEEQRRVREQMREEEKVRRDIEKAEKKAEQEERTYEAALEKARLEIKGKTQKQRNILEEKIQELEKRLKESHENKERALSMAQQTKRGHVYVISNIGSFGDNIYKIGLTRRLIPEDRVKELGDASVPFSFDVHAMIFSENAPKLENHLHNLFNYRRVNRINTRKEFFKVNLLEVEEECKKFDKNVEFTKFAEAKEYYQTQSLLKEEEANKQKANKQKAA